MDDSMGRPAHKRPTDPKAVDAATLSGWFDALLTPTRFKDYCPNGLQVEGDRPIRLLVSGVTASLALINAAAERGADALLVHHGWFWKGENPCLIGPKGARIRALVRPGMHLFAYHLPLDLHPEVGNNTQLGRQLGWSVDGRGGESDLVVWHDLGGPCTVASLANHLEGRLGRAPFVVGPLDQAIRRIAWCTGGAQDLIEDAARLGAQAFVSGEISERTTHLARELGLSYFAAGHHATERYGVQALGERAAAELGLAHQFIDDPNPV